jgi:hypothetical protein
MKHTLKTVLTTTLLTASSVFGSAQPTKSAAAQSAPSPSGTEKDNATPAGQLPRLPVTQLSEPADQAATSPGATALAVEVEAARPIASELIEIFKSSTSFDNTLDRVLKMKAEAGTATDAELAQLKDVINTNKSFNVTHKKILTGLLPNATLNDIRDAALQLLTNRDYKRGVALLERSPEYKGATSDYILGAANILKRLMNVHYGESAKYRERAAALFEQAATTPGATPADIRRAAEGLASLRRDADQAKVAELYEQLAKSENPENVGWAVNGFVALSQNSSDEKSDEYYNRSVELRTKLNAIKSR